MTQLTPPFILLEGAMWFSLVLHNGVTTMAHWLPSSNLMSSNHDYMYAACRETQLTNRMSGIIWMIHIQYS